MSNDRGSSDYFGLNHYTSRIAIPVEKSDHDGWIQDSGYITSVDPKWPSSSSYVHVRLKILSLYNCYILVALQWFVFDWLSDH